MKIAVCVSHVPDTATKVKIGEDGKTIDPNGVTYVINPYDEIAVEEALKTKEKFIILDVREYWEIEKVNLKDNRVIVLLMSQIVHKGLDAIPAKVMNKEEEIIIICHHGIRCAQVTGWLSMQDWTNVNSLRGGVNAFAQQIDQLIGFY